MLLGKFRAHRRQQQLNDNIWQRLVLRTRSRMALRAYLLLGYLVRSVEPLRRRVGVYDMALPDE